MIRFRRRSSPSTHTTYHHVWGVLDFKPRRTLSDLTGHRTSSGVCFFFLKNVFLRVTCSCRSKVSIFQEQNTSLKRQQFFLSLGLFWCFVLCVGGDGGGVDGVVVG